MKLRRIGVVVGLAFGPLALLSFRSAATDRISARTGETISSAQPNGRPELTGPYLGQKPPGMTPVAFAPFLFSKSKPEWAFCTEFSPDGAEFYFTECDAARNIERIMVMRRVANVWTEPEVAPFSGAHNDNDVRLAPDGNVIFWRSWRPLPGNGRPEERSVIWHSERTAGSWSTAKPVKCNDSPLRAGYPSISKKGMLFFPARIEEGLTDSDIYCSRFADGFYDTPESLGHPVNTKYIEGDLFVAPDERFLIVSCWNRPDNNGDSDLYISFRDRGGTWSPLINLGDKINTGNNENCPSISPDGNYFFFMSADVKSKPAKTSTYWVSAKVIEEVRLKELKQKRQ